ncbi:type II toxin-antitoxin system RelE/ParE family toxin [Polaribacter porphyrae]|uniref:Plasmid stabilization protein n=1 Tax=Polaribacter porphyrae TaxID=1137780 RepID=A0A2S7WNE8_9FLAO|nr:type II toxin-antitoxin system RelE/ParE family toxin [Polaribacter porphyrae]PQJ79137.1 plasmid stabilization protein [Polaribacter porphyrae]
MEFEIVWSDFAETQLDEIYNYYKNKASKSVATKLLRGIIQEPNKLIKSSLIGQKEELLKQRENVYRYLIFKNYKIIYSVDNEKRFIKIVDVFDTRQNPPKLKRTK